MKIKHLLIISAASVFSLAACDKSEKQDDTTASDSVSGSVVLSNELDSLSYALGVNMASNLKRADVTEINAEALGAGVSKAMTDSANSMMSLEDANKIINTYFEKLQAAKAESQTKEGREWLAANSSKEGVKTTASGLQYKVITQGTGKTPGPSSQVTVHYHGTLVDGSVFDSSMDRGEPIQLRVNGVIKGWTEALQMMKEGDVWELYIPYDLAYGAQGRPGIPPYATLIFKVQLISVDS